MNKLVLFLALIEFNILSAQTITVSGNQFQPSGNSVVIRADTLCLYNTKDSFAKIALPAGHYIGTIYAKGDMAPTDTDYPRIRIARNLVTNVLDSVVVTSKKFMPYTFNFESVSDTTLLYVKMSKDYRDPRVTPPLDRNAYFYKIELALAAAPEQKDTTTVRVSWNANTEQDLAGYRIYYGYKSRTYTQVLDVGNVTSKMISGVFADTTIYAALTAYDVAGNESDYSIEVSKFLRAGESIHIFFPSEGSVVETDTVRIIYSINTGDSSRIATVKLDDNTFIVVGLNTTNILLENITEGQHSVTLELWDRNNNMILTKIVTFSILKRDTTAPNSPTGVIIIKIKE